jgi:nicotinamide-nucleotide amidase
MRLSNPTVGLAAHTGQVDIRIAARAEDPQRAEAMLDAVEARVREQVGAYIYSTTPEERFETVLAKRMQPHNVTMALLETNTRGALAERLATALPGYSPLVRTAVSGQDALPPELSVAAAPESVDSMAREALAVQAAEWLRTATGAGRTTTPMSGLAIKR